MLRYRTVFVTERGLRHQQDALAAAPAELDVMMLRSPARAELYSYLRDADFLISERAGIIDSQTIGAAPHLKLIVRLGSLAHDIDLEAARAQRVAVTLWPVRGTIMVAEHAMLQMLALSKRLIEVNHLAMAAGDWATARRTDEDTFAFNWTARSGIGAIWGSTVGILGFGEVGAELAQRLLGWDCSVLYNRRRRLPPATEARLGIRYAPWEEVLAASDFLVNLLPYSPETDHALGAAQFARMRPGAFIVSCGSGSVIDEAALAEALAIGHLCGAALDTYEWEPIQPDNPLRALVLEDAAQNILLTPHTAGGAPQPGATSWRTEEYTPITQFLRGEPLLHRIA